ncbi:MAG: ribose-5-phosphate isomerase RpiA [Rhodobiaceae bacterium]|nr:ribose-5-phosphate isomerase RpiA [Rhodobiaceae bacterium]MCC0041031.1 ribose-5-phosphate isomerase RpiA [Rhodobiaceae bacterium]MCC0053922.1 ribose-5-phosphate isomerase RpiA [Rhodobiaceae bacterium]
MADLDAYKKEVGTRAAALVADGMKLGLGTGSTAAHFVRALGERVRAEGLDIVGVPTSRATAELAREMGIALTTLDETPRLDLTIDGADEIDPALRLIKGGGGAHLREKIVASASARMIVIADETKVVDTLGGFPLPLEVLEFGMAATRAHVELAARAHGCDGAIVRRMKPDGSAFVTDEGNAVLDCHFRAISNAEGLAAALDGIPGLVEHGLFIGMASGALIAGRDGVTSMGKI